MLSMGFILKRQAELRKDKEAVIFGTTRLTYNDLNRRVNQLAAGLREKGILKGDRAAILSQNCHQYIEAFYAVAKLGAILVPINWRLVGGEIKYALDDSGSKVLIYGEDFADTVKKIKDDLKTVTHYIVIGQHKDNPDADYENLIAQYPGDEPGVEVDMEDPFIIMYTSGTTGLPKGAVLTQGNIIWTSVNQSMDVTIGADDRALVVAPMFHVGGLLIFTVPIIHVGGSMVIQRQFNVANFLQCVEEEKNSIVFMAPTMFHMLVQNPDIISKYNVSSLKKMFSGGASIPLPTMRRMIELFPECQFTEGYGITEGSSSTCVLRPEYVLTKSGSIGKPLIHNEWRIVDENHVDVGPGQVGEIILRGVTVMKEYWNNPEATRKAFHEGWFHTGDLATKDEDGFVNIVDRKKDMIISGAENIYPKEIEDVLYNHPKILEVAVIGVPDEKWGELVKAIVVTKPGLQMTEEEVIDYCKERLASYKKPRIVAFVDELPKNPSGKVLKTELRKQHS